MNIQDKERRVIRDAMDRLLAGTPIRSDGKLTIKSLAAEAGVKRWLLTHRHLDLQDEFRDKIHTHGSTPAAMRSLAAENDRLAQQLDKVRAGLKQAHVDNNHYTRVIQVLTTELEQKNSPAKRTAAKVTPFNRINQPH